MENGEKRNTYGFEKAERRKSLLRLALVSPSGCGKTKSALILGSGLADKLDSRLAVIDTENGSSQIYAEEFDFDVNPLSDFSPESYAKSIYNAEKAGYKVLVVDGLSDEWAFVLAEVDRIAQNSSSKNKFNAWGRGTEIHNKLMTAIKNFNGHIIVTIRAKTAYEIQTNHQNKKVPVKLGLKPEQRDGFEYEFDSVIDLDTKHYISSDKDRTGLFSESRILTNDDANLIYDWINIGKDDLLPPSPTSEEVNRCAIDAKEIEDLTKIKLELIRKNALTDEASQALKLRYAEITKSKKAIEKTIKTEDGENDKP